jgi:hypothetical protein
MMTFVGTPLIGVGVNSHWRTASSAALSSIGVGPAEARSGQAGGEGGGATRIAAPRRRRSP